MRSSFNRRQSMLTAILAGVGILLFAKIASFPFQADAAAYLEDQANNSYRQLRDLIPDRGRILDRNGDLLAGNVMEYTIAASPNLMLDKARAAHLLAGALKDDENRILKLLDTPNSQYVVLAQQADTATAQRVAQLNLLGMKLEPVAKRIHPQGSLAAQLIGFVAGRVEDGSRRGYVGVEGEYNGELAGQVQTQPISPIPFEVNAMAQPPAGHDIVLTIDRSVQYLAETQLQTAINKYGATSGSVVIMDPRTGEILAMASYPSFDPDQFYKTNDPSVLKNPAVSSVYEPGSAFKIVTGSVALQSGKMTPDWTYYDKSPLVVGGRQIFNWDRAGHGSQNFVDVFVNSWNIGTSTIAMTLGPDIFYKGLKDFGVGQRTGIDLEGEAGGILHTPGDLYWSDSDLATNSFGQGLAVTPLQMLSFTNVIADGGQMMQPHIRLKMLDGDHAIPAIPSAVRTPISPAVAKTMTDIMVRVVQVGEGIHAKVPGYTVAGKTGTAQIPCTPGPGCSQGFDDQLYKATFIGFLPADEPRVSILIELDNVARFASETAAPAWSELVQRLVVLMEIPTDQQRQALKAQGGNTALIAGNQLSQ